MPALLLSILCLITFAAYSPALRALYVRWDDTKHIVGNVPVFMPFSLETLKNIFTSFINNTYIPLTTLSFHIQHHTVGLDAFTSHLINVLGHILVIVLVYILYRRAGTNSSAAMIACALFALHPMHVESIAWATERKDILCGIFYLLTLLAYQQYLQHPQKRSYMLSLGLGLLAILSKAMAVSIPWILLLLDWHHDKKITRARLLSKIPFAVIIFPVAALTFFQLDGHPTLHFPDSPLIMIWSAAFYLQKFCWPYPLLPAYSPEYPVAITHPAYWIAALVLGLAAFGLWAVRKNRLLIFAGLFYLLTIFFFVRVDLADVNVVADRFIYVPSIGLCLILGIVLEKTHRIIPIALCLALGILTFAQTLIWQNDNTLWRHVLTYQPYNRLAQEKMRQLRTAQQHPRVDYQHFHAMLSRVPNKAKAYLKRGNDLAASGDFPLALDDFNFAIALDPKLEEAYINRGNVYQARGDMARAFADFDKAIALNPSSSGLLSKAILLGLDRKHDEALQYFQRALATNKDLDRALYERGYFFAQIGQCEKAIADLSASIIHNSTQADTYYQRGLCAYSTENWELAKKDFIQTVLIRPQDDAAFGQLCRVGLRTQQLSAAIKDCSKAISLNDTQSQYYNDRAKAYFLLGAYDKAITDLDRVIALDPQNSQAHMIRNQIGQFANPK